MSSLDSIDLNALDLGLSSPLNRDLFWRHCDLKALAKHDWHMTKSDPVSASVEESFDNAIIFINGVYSKNLSTHADYITIEKIENKNIEKPLNKDYFRLLNNKIKTPTYYINVKNGNKTSIIKVLHIVYGLGNIYIPLNLHVETQENCEGSIEYHYRILGETSAWINQVVDYHCEKYSKLTTYEFYDQAENINITHTSEVDLKEKANFKQFIANKHFGFMYYQQDVCLNGLMASWKAFGFYILNENQRAHYRLKAHHKAKNTVSKQFMRGLLSDASWALFDSSVIVDKGAKGSDSYQMNNNLLLGKKAKVQSFPILEIDEDDVVCSHGSTIGAFDDAMLFYLQSRGLSLKQSFSLMKRAFISEVIQKFNEKEVNAQLKKYIQHKD